MLELDENVRHILETGDDFFLNLTDEQVGEFWQAHRDAFLSAWIIENPGTRPHAWWRFDAPEPRRCVNGAHPFARRGYDAQRRLVGGRPALVVPGISDDAEFETQFDYLSRLGILADGEREALQATENANGEA